MVFLVFVFTLLFIVTGFIVKAFFLKNIRYSASIFASHFDIRVDPDLNIRLKINKKTPWSEQSYSYRRILSLFETLTQAFSLGFTVFLVLLIRDLFPPLIAFWDIASVAFGYFLLFLLVYRWSRSWLPRILTGLIHLPVNTFLLLFTPIPLTNLMTVGTVGALTCALASHSLQSGQSNDLDLILTSIFGASGFFLLRILPVVVNDNFGPRWETIDEIMENYEIRELLRYKLELIKDIQELPNFDIWIRSLPDDVSSVVWNMLEDEHDLQLMKKADILPEKDLITYPFLVSLLCRNPEVLEYKITKVLEEMKDSITSWKPQA